MTDKNWVEEAWDGVVTRYAVADDLHDSKTPFQNMQFVQSVHYGRMLLLDGMVQTTEKDEFVYHEMMTHVPMFTHKCPKNVLIIGGGDGGILREVLRHDTVESAVMVEIDQGVVDFSKEYLPTISAGSFDDPRADVVIDDGAKYIKETDRLFDVIIVDSPDPIGPARVLFTQEFYANLSRCLADGGVMSRQSGSTFMQPEEVGECLRQARPQFDYSTAYVYAVPTYIGGLFSSLLCAKGVDPKAVTIEQLQERFATLPGKCRYYNPGVHFGALQLPGYVEEALESGETK